MIEVIQGDITKIAVDTVQQFLADNPGNGRGQLKHVGFLNRS